MQILAVDPGLATGLVWGELGDLKYDTIQYPEIYYFLDKLINDVTFDIVVIENFLISGQTGKKSQAPWSLKIIGACEVLCYLKGIEVVLQTPVEAKTFVTDKKLRSLNLWIKGPDHVRDAMRHYLLFIYKNYPEQLLG